MYKIAIQLPSTRHEAPNPETYELEMAAMKDLVIEKIDIPLGTTQEFIAAARDADALMVSWGVPITQEIINGLEKCRIISVGSVGVDMIDIDAATEAGIVVTNTPDVFIEETADHSMTMVLAAFRRLKQMDDMVRTNRWKEGRPVLSQFPRLMSQTLGLLAFGNVATGVARRAKGFGLHVIAHDPYVSELKMSAEGVEPVTLTELFERSDLLSLHPPLNSETHHMISDVEFAAMKPGVVLVNCSRGGVVDEQALIRALQSGQVGAAGLDVLEQEPPAPDNLLLQMDNVILTPHAASATRRMRLVAQSRVTREIALVLGGRWPMSPVNPTVMPRVELERWQPYPMERGPNR
jgi:D-3-phosphoglycerate dehydrogenase